jgi:lysophospholipase L1-like esterase
MRGYWTRPSVALANVEDASEQLATLVSPLTGDEFVEGESILLVADAPTGSTAVEFFADSLSLGTVTGYPWALLWAPAAAGAFSLRAVVTGAIAAGAAVDVSVSAAPTLDPTSVAGVVAVFDPSEASARTVTSGRVSALANRDGTAVLSDQTQGTAAARPVLDKLRGVEALHFGSGTAEKLTGAVTGTIAQPWTAIAVQRSLTRGTLSPIFVANRSVAIEGASWPRSASLNANITLAGAGSIPASESHLVTYLANGLSGTVRVDGAQVAVGSSGTGTLNGTSYLGGSASLSPPQVLGETIVATGLSSTDRDAIEAYLTAKWRLADTRKTVLFVGDSNTFGVGSSEGNGWRRMLWDAYTSRAKIGGKWIEAIGIREEYAYADDCHYGESGKGINYMRANLPANLGAAGQWSPDIVFMMIGTNNCRSLAGETYVPGTGAGSTYAEYVALCGDILTALPGATLAVSTVLDCDPVDALTRANIVDMNSWLPSAWNAVESAHSVTLVRADMRAMVGDYAASLYDDIFHLSDAGYAVAAGVVMRALCVC